jgi:hypothetical protein
MFPPSVVSHWFQFACSQLIDLQNVWNNRWPKIMRLNSRPTVNCDRFVKRSQCPQPCLVEFVVVYSSIYHDDVFCPQNLLYFVNGARPIFGIGQNFENWPARISEKKWFPICVVSLERSVEAHKDIEHCLILWEIDQRWAWDRPSWNSSTCMCAVIRIHSPSGLNTISWFEPSSLKGGRSCPRVMLLRSVLVNYMKCQFEWEFHQHSREVVHPDV